MRIIVIHENGGTCIRRSLITYALRFASTFSDMLVYANEIELVLTLHKIYRNTREPFITL